MSRTLQAPLSGLYPILDGSLIPLPELAAAARVLCSSGVEQVQLRLKDKSDRDRLEAQREVALALEGSSACLVINDRPDLAKILREEAPPGVRVALHLGQGDLDPEEARGMVGDDVHISLSTHTLSQVEASAALPLDGIAFGPVFPTSSKEEPDPCVGLDGLAEACRLSALPVTAIGGISKDSVALCRSAGASSFAVIGALLSPWNPGTLQARAETLMERWHE